MKGKDGKFKGKNAEGPNSAVSPGKKGGKETQIPNGGKGKKVKNKGNLNVISMLNKHNNQGTSD